VVCWSLLIPGINGSGIPDVKGATFTAHLHNIISLHPGHYRVIGVSSL